MKISLHSLASLLILFPALSYAGAGHTVCKIQMLKGSPYPVIEQNLSFQALAGGGGMEEANFDALPNLRLSCARDSNSVNMEDIACGFYQNGSEINSTTLFGIKKGNMLILKETKVSVAAGYDETIVMCNL